MGQASSSNESYEREGILIPRTPPSPSTYANFLATQRLSHLAPDIPDQFDHKKHIHATPERGIYDCPKGQYPKIEDRYGYCFTIREDGPTWGKRALWTHGQVDAGMMTGVEIKTLTQGDVFGVLAACGLLVLGALTFYAIKWVLALGKRLTADARARGYKKLPATGGKIRRPRAASAVRQRRGGFLLLDGLPEDHRVMLKRESSSMEEKRETPREVYVEGEWAMKLRK